MQTVFAVVFTLAGTAIGSFLNVCIDRLPVGKSIVYPPSRCDSCQHGLQPVDLIPIVSYLFLGGRCRYCQARILWRVPVVEALTGALFGLAFWRYGMSLEFAAAIFYCSLLIMIGFIDLETGSIFPLLVYPATGLALIISIWLPGTNFLDAVLGALVGSAILFVPYIVSLYVFHIEGMGWADIILAAFIGAATGFHLVLVSMLLAIYLGGLVAGFLWIFRIKGRKAPIPFGPFLSAAAVITIFWGNTILNWYLNWF